MWELKEPGPVKLFVGILAADKESLKTAVETLEKHFGELDCISETWPFKQTDYYRQQTGENILRQFVSVKKLVWPGELARIKHKTNELEQELAKRLKTGLARPVNFDPGLLEPSKLVLATTKNYSHRIYIGDKIYAEVTLIYEKGQWKAFDYTYPDYRQQSYFDFFSKVRKKLVEQLKQ